MTSEFDDSDDRSRSSGSERPHPVGGGRTNVGEVIGESLYGALEGRRPGGRGERDRYDPASRLPPRKTGPVGWSLVIAVLSIAAVATLAVSKGSTTIGVIACGGMVLSAWGLVLAELASRYFRDDP